MEKIKEFAIKNLSLIKGLGAMLLGIALVGIAHKVFINLIVFSCGALLIYYAMVELKLRKATSFINNLISRLKR